MWDENFVFVPGMWDPKGSFGMVVKFLEGLSYPCFDRGR